MFTRIEPDWVEPFATPLGLPRSTPLRDLGPVVVLAGPNGSGKSRYLKALRNLLHQAKEVEGLANGGTTAEKVAETLANQPPELPREPRQMQIAALHLREAHPEKTNFNFCHLTQPANATVQDAAATGAGAHESCVRGCETLGLQYPYEYQHVYLDAVARQLELRNRKDVDANDPRVARAGAFNRLLSEFLGTDITPILNSVYSHDARLFNRAFNPTELSSGQKVLIAWAIALHAQSGLGETTIFIDEPENHLHPDVCIRALDTLRRRAEDSGGQIWIATHSVAIIAWAGADCLHTVEQGNISYAGNRVQQVIDTLSGGSEHREALRNFLAEANHFGFYHFVGQCLAKPGVIEHAPNKDPQTRAFADLIESLMKDGHCRVLDFGAGKGRLADAIARSSNDLKNLTYFLYDLDEEFRKERDAVAKRLLERGAKAKVLDELGECRVDGSQVDLVVLCNVLHEIPSAEWLEVFRKIEAVLAPTGKLAIIEDQEPRVGELPHNKGFLLLNANEVAQLFGGHEYIEDKSPGSGVSEGRISVLCVAQPHLHRATPERLGKTLTDLYERAKGEVNKLRMKGSQRDGRRHALYMVLAYNALESGAKK